MERRVQPRALGRGWCSRGFVCNRSRQGCEEGTRTSAWKELVSPWVASGRVKVYDNSNVSRVIFAGNKVSNGRSGFI
eukprot:767162-Hanusia_phi.AAC.3